jgi:ribosomal protein S18 acetylase RimI-like enzyme
MEPLNKKFMTKKEIIDSFNKNTNFMIASHFEGIDEVSVAIEEDASFVHSNIPDESFNYVFENHFKKDSANIRIKEIIEFFKQKNVPWTWWVSPGDTPDELECELSKFGFAKTEEYRGMFCDMSARNILLHLPNIDVKKVRTISQLRDFYTVHASENFDNIWRKMSRKIFDDYSALEFYVGYADQKPVTAGLVVFHAGIAGIYSVATDQHERKKGYATALMDFLLNRIEEKGYEHAVLSTSANVKMLYGRLGFQDMCVYRGWKKPANYH